MLEDIGNSQDCEDIEEMRLCRNISQERIFVLWKELCGKMEEEVFEKYNVEATKKGAYTQRGEPPTRRWEEDCWVRIFSWFREDSFQRNNKFSCRKNGSRRNKAATENCGHGRDDEVTEGKGQNGCALAADCKKNMGPPRMRGHTAAAA